MHIGNFACTYEIASGFLVDKNRQYGQVLVESDGLGSTLASYVHANDLVGMERSGVDSFYLVDGQLSTRALTDAVGDVTDTYSYEAFGNEVSSSGSSYNAYRYAGEQLDEVLGDYYLRARYMSPQSGRFSGMDFWSGLASRPSALHRYNYAEADPVQNLDPSGNMTLLESIIVGSIVTTLAAIYVSTEWRKFSQNRARVKVQSDFRQALVIAKAHASFGYERNLAKFYGVGADRERVKGVWTAIAALMQNSSVDWKDVSMCPSPFATPHDVICIDRASHDPIEIHVLPKFWELKELNNSISTPYEASRSGAIIHEFMHKEWTMSELEFYGQAALDLPEGTHNPDNYRLQAEYNFYTVWR